MTKKDFIAIAGAIKDAREALLWNHETGDGVGMDMDTNRVFDSLARDVAKVCATTNPKFDRSRFLAACGVK